MFSSDLRMHWKQRTHQPFAPEPYFIPNDLSKCTALSVLNYSPVDRELTFYPLVIRSRHQLPSTPPSLSHITLTPTMACAAAKVYMLLRGTPIVMRGNTISALLGTKENVAQRLTAD